jgi:SPP1 gp7 family putative phage head morphogenesis protein
MYLNHVGHELGVIKPRLIILKTGDSAKQQALMKAMSRLHLESTVSFNEMDATVEFPEVTDAGVMAAGKSMIDFHYSTMAKSVLAQFIDLGSNISETGSRAVATTQVDFFKEGLQSMAKILIEEMWNTVIADIVKLNFNNGIFPTLIVKPIADNRVDLLISAFQDLVKQGKVTNTVRGKLIEAGSTELGLDISEEEILQDLEEERAIGAEMRAIKAQSRTSIEEDKEQEEMGEHIDHEIHLEEVSRELFPDEQKVKIADLKRFWDDSRGRAELVLKEKLQKQKDEIISKYIKAVRSGQGAIDSTTVELEEESDIMSPELQSQLVKEMGTELPEQTYSEAMQTIASQLYEFGKQGVADELKKPVPNTPKKDRAYREAKVKSVIKKQQSDLDFRLSSVASNALMGNVSEDQTKLLLDKEYNDFWSNVLIATVGALTSEMINRGRQTAFEKYSDDIFAYRYTAVLDNNTTDFCRQLDGRIFQTNDPNYALLTPPNHYGCRSYWTPVTKQEAIDQDIEVNGKPLELPVFGSIDSFKSTALTEELDKKMHIMLDYLNGEKSETELEEID